MVVLDEGEAGLALLALAGCYWYLMLGVPKQKTGQALSVTAVTTPLRGVPLCQTRNNTWRSDNSCLFLCRLLALLQVQIQELLLVLLPLIGLLPLLTVTNTALLLCSTPPPAPPAVGVG